MNKVLLAVIIFSSSVYGHDYIPRICLHYHLGTSPSRSVLEKIAQKNNVTLSPDLYNFQEKGDIYNDYTSFSQASHHFNVVLIKPEDYYTLTLDAIESAEGRGIILFEFMVSPTIHPHFQGTWKEKLTAVNDAIKMARKNIPGIKPGAILTFVKNPLSSGAQEMEYLEYIVRNNLTYFVGIHLAGDEKENEDYSYLTKVYRYAKKKGLGVAAHAGEWGNAQNIKKAVQQLGVTRIGHGIRAIDDETIVQLLIKNNILLEGCPSSNISTGAQRTRRFADLPMKKLFDKGVRIYPCNPDDSRLFNDTTEQHEAEILKKNLGFTDEELLLTQEMGIQSSFLNKKDKETCLKIHRKDKQAHKNRSKKRKSYHP
jgi:adenosine deaminase